jgi:hypothetical protein
MNTSALNKFLSIFSIASIATTILVDPAFAKPVVYYGTKGTYTVDYEAGTYRGCLNSGGCITLGRKYLIPCSSKKPEYCGGIGWRKGQYQYGIDEGMIVVSKNGQTIFEDGASITR